MRWGESILMPKFHTALNWTRMAPKRTPITKRSHKSACRKGVKSRPTPEPKVILYLSTINAKRTRPNPKEITTGNQSEKEQTDNKTRSSAWLDKLGKQATAMEGESTLQFQIEGRDIVGLASKKNPQLVIPTARKDCHQKDQEESRQEGNSKLLLK